MPDLSCKPRASHVTHRVRKLADVLLLDQNIGKDLLGTELAARARGFKGVTCVLTGSSKGEVARLGALPHVDVCAEKGTPITALGARLSRALAAKRQATA